MPTEPHHPNPLILASPAGLGEAWEFAPMCVGMGCVPQGCHLCPSDAQCGPVLWKLGKEITKERGHSSPRARKGMQR